MRDLGPASRLDNTRIRSLSRRASLAPHKSGRRPPWRRPDATSRKGSRSMFWQSQGGGPWGSGPRGGGPWGGNRGGGSGPRGRGPQPPDFEELLRRGQDRFRRVLPGGFGTGTGIAIVAIAILGIWLASGFYRVLPV